MIGLMKMETISNTEEAFFNNLNLGIVYYDLSGKILKSNNLAKHYLNLIDDNDYSNIIEKNGYPINKESLPFRIALDKQKLIQDKYIGIYNKDISNFEWYVVDAFPVFEDSELKYIVETHKKTECLNNSEKSLSHLVKVLNAVRKVNQLITHEKDTERLIEQACNLLTENRGYFNAWIALFDKNQNFVTAGESGLDDNFNSMINNLKSGTYPKCTKNALENSNLQVIENPDIECTDCPLSKMYENRGAFVMLLRHKNNDYGIISVSIPTNYINDKYEQDIFKEVVNDISYALYNIDLTKQNEEHKNLLLDKNKKIKELLREEKIQNEILKYNEEYLNSILQTTFEGFWMVDLSGIIRDVNESYLKLTGYTQEEIVGMHISEIDINDSIEDVKIRINRIIKNKFELFNSKHRKKDGRIFDIEMSVTYTEHNGGNFICFGRDTSELKKALDRKKESELKFNEIFSKANIGIAIADNQGNQTDVNNELLKMLGYSYSEFTSKHFTDLSNKDDLFEENKLIEKLLDNRLNNFRIEKRLIKKDGSEIWADVSLTVIRDSNGDIQNYIAMMIDINHQKSIENSLRESESRYKKLVETSVDCIYLINENAIIIDTNNTASEFLNKSKSEIIGKPVDLIDPNFPVSAFIDFWEKVPYDKQLIFETTHKLKDGEEIPVEVAGKKFKIENKTHYYGLVRDITERKKIETKIRESEQKFRTIFEYANIGIATADKNGDIIDVNQEFEIFIGYSKSELLQMNFRDLTHPDDLKKEVELLNKILTNKISNYRIEKRYINKNNEILWGDVSVTVKHDENGEIEMFIGMIMNITQHKKNSEQLKSRELLFNNVLSSIPDMVSIHDSNLNILFSNWNGFANVPEEERIFHTKCYKTYRGYDEICPDCRASNVLKTKKLHHSEAKLSNGRWVDLRVIPLFDEDGNCNEFVEWVRDITDLKETEDKILEKNIELENSLNQIKDINLELEEAKGRAEESDRLKSAFLANMSHEIRTPMNGILGFTQLLKMPDLSEEEKNEYISIIEQSSERLITTINDLIDISKIEAGQMNISIEETNINKIIDDLYSFFILQTKKQSLEYNYIKSLSDEDALIKSDNSKLYAILINLIKNALKFTEKGKIEYGYYLRDNFIEFFVKDTGIGIEEEFQNIIFDRFSQADTNLSRNYEGSGLGLAISKAYAEMLGGKIWIKSKVGEGSTFLFSVPYIPSNNDKKETILPNNNIDIHLDKISVIIAEDDETSYIYLKKTLTNKVKKIIRARTGEEAITLLKENPDINLILMDIKMPKMDGYTATKKIREFNKDIRIIATTAYALHGDEQKAIRSGCNKYISKPINPQQLIKLISNLNIS